MGRANFIGGTILGNPLGTGSGSVFVPTDVTGLKEWGKADGTLYQDSGRTTPVTANNDPVGAADDASGNANHLLQATAGKRPLYKTNIQNGKPGLLFDSALSQYLSQTGFLANTPWYAVIVAQPTFDPATVAGTLCDKGNIDNRRIVRVQNGGARVSSLAAGTVRGAVAQNTTYIFAGAITTGVASYVAINGTEYAAEDLSPDNGGSGLCLGITGDAATAPWKGYIFEWMFFDNIPAAGDRTALLNYANSAARWSVY